MEWQTLAQLAKGSAAMTKEGFRAQFPAPFLIELNPEAGALGGGETRAFSPQVAEELKPSLSNSQIINLSDGQSFVVGRAEEAGIRCLQESVSAQHCQLERFGTMWSVKDAGSKNGTVVNGQQLRPTDQIPLKFGSKIQLGQAQFLFLSPDEAYELVQELSKEPRIRPRSLGKYQSDFAGVSPEKLMEEFQGPFLVVQAPQGRDAAPAAGPVSTNTVTLSAEDLKKGVNKNVADAVFNLSNHNVVRIGRGTITQIHLPLGAVSALHCILIREDGKWVVQDMGSKNGTYVWGERVEGRRDLESGMEIMLGNIKSIFFNTEDLVTYAVHRDTLV